MICGTEARAALVAAARDSIARGSKSFASASRLFDRVTRERAWLLYAWCRACDDLADGQVMGHGRRAVDDPMARLETIKVLTEAALRGEETGSVPFDALGLVVAECGTPPELPRDLVRGFALDAVSFQPRDESDLYRYCYHVAGVVGVMMASIMGVRPDDETVLDRACDLGIAFQLANIARDLGEDAAAGRCYLPEDWRAQNIARSLPCWRGGWRTGPPAMRHRHGAGRRRCRSDRPGRCWRRRASMVISPARWWRGASGRGTCGW